MGKKFLFRYLIISTILLSVAWAVVSVKLGDRTIYGHIRAGGMGAKVISWFGGAYDSAKSRWVEWRKDEEKKPALKRRAPKKKTPVANKEATKRYALLKAAAKEVEKSAPAAKKQTKFDRRPSKAEKRSLDALVAKASKR